MSLRKACFYRDEIGLTALSCQFLYESKVVKSMNSKKICTLISFFSTSAITCFGSIFSVSSNGIFLHDTYSVPQGKNIFIAPSSKVSYDKSWSSEDSSVAIVDSHGIVRGIKKGKTCIKAINKDDSNESYCTVEVTEPEILKNCYSSVCLVMKNEDFEVCAITDKCVEAVKFKINGAVYNSERECTKSTNASNGKIWKLKISIPKNGTFEINVDCKVGSEWKKSSDKSIRDILVTDDTDIFIPNLNRKRISKSAAKFIASCEGMQSKVYIDASGFFTIGCGKKIESCETFYDNLSHDEILAYFMQSLNFGVYSSAVNDFLIANNIMFSQCQFDALVSFTFNLGPGWIRNGSHLKDVLLNCKNETRVIDKATVRVNDSLRLRESPNTSSCKLRLLPNGTKLTVLDTNKINGNWYKVRIPNGTVGYCCGDYLELYQETFSGKCLDNIDQEEFINEFMQYHHADKKCLSALLSRRAQELDMFFNGIYTKFDWKHYKKTHYELPVCVAQL